MALTIEATYKNGVLKPKKRLKLPDGSKVVVQIETASPEASTQQDDEATRALKSAFPFIGQWADRDDIPDSAAYAREQRAKWQQRPYRQD